MKFAIVGCGAIAWRGHLPALSKLEDVEVTSVVDLDKTRAKRTAKKFGVRRYYTTVDEILKDEELDVVVIATPTPTHKDLAIKVADAGKHIIVEKPLATSLSEGLSIKEAVKKNNVKLCVVQNYRYFPSIRQARKIVRQGFLGKITNIYGIAHTPWPNQWTRGTWLYYEPGVLLDFSPHIVDAILWITNGKPQRVYAIGGDFTGHSNFINYAQISIVFKNKVIGTIDVSWLTGTFRYHLYFMGTSGMLEVDPRFNVVFRSHGIPTPIDDIRYFLTRMKIIGDVVTGRFFTMPQFVYQYFYKDFIRALETNGRMPVTIEEALETLAVLEGAYKSIKNNVIVDIEL